ncbi:MAG TPA: hypothetical protein VGF55_02010 [Gemmataceae bacterium]|jgi:hypothetical protein
MARLTDEQRRYMRAAVAELVSEVRTFLGTPWAVEAAGLSGRFTGTDDAQVYAYLAGGHARDFDLDVDWDAAGRHAAAVVRLATRAVRPAGN